MGERPACRQAGGTEVNQICAFSASRVTRCECEQNGPTFTETSAALPLELWDQVSSELQQLYQPTMEKPSSLLERHLGQHMLGLLFL